MCVTDGDDVTKPLYILGQSSNSLDKINSLQYGLFDNSFYHYYTGARNKLVWGQCNDKEIDIKAVGRSTSTRKKCKNLAENLKLFGG